MDVEDHAEELASDLGADRAEVLEDLRNLRSYDVPMDEAKQSLRRKYGDDATDEPTAVSLADVTTSDSNVTVTARVLTVGKRSIYYDDEEQVIFEGELADESGRIDYTAWTDFGLSPGDTVTAGNADVREWEGEPELNLGDSTTVVFEDETLDVPYEVGGEAGLAELEPGDRGITVEVSVLETEDKTIDGRAGETDIRSGVIGDETARLPFTDWDPRDSLVEGATVRVEDAYVREFRGVPSLNVSEFSVVTPLDREVAVSGATTGRTIREAVESGGLFDVELVGTVVAVRDGSGLVQRCPECGRVIQKGRCRSHGEVDGEDDLRTKAIVDDGTGTVTAILGTDLTAEVYGGDVSDAVEHARDAMDQSVVADEIRGRVEGREFRVRGNLSVDDYGPNLDVTSFERADDDPAERARTLLAEAGR